jgi:hypothetical protein
MIWQGEPGDECLRAAEECLEECLEIESVRQWLLKWRWDGGAW